MGQITIHLDSKFEEKAKDQAKSMNMSLEKWIADIIREKVSPGWPESVKKLAGAWSDFPTLEVIRSGMGKDAKREKL